MHCSDDISPWQSNKKTQFSTSKTCPAASHNWWLWHSQNTGEHSCEGVLYGRVSVLCTYGAHFLQWIRHMNSPMYRSWVLLWMKPGGEMLKVARRKIWLWVKAVCVVHCEAKDNVTLGAEYVKRFSNNNYLKPEWVWSEPFGLVCLSLV